MEANKIDLIETIEHLKPSLKPPVSNSMLFNDALKVMVVGGPNQRKDFHIEMGQELFYQYQGDMDLVIMHPSTQRPEAIRIKEGEVFLLPAGIPHSPQRYADTIGVVFERDRLTGEVDCLRWYNGESEGFSIQYEEFLFCADLGTQIKQAIERWQAHMAQGGDFDKAREPALPVVGLVHCMEAASRLPPLIPPFGLRTFLNTHIGETVSTIFQSEFQLVAYRGSMEGPVTHTVALVPTHREVFLWQLEGLAMLKLKVNLVLNYLWPIIAILGLFMDKSNSKIITLNTVPISLTS
ncbi:hypothetical protein EON64_17840 [archaeon]|nr:MAG: hypothetical protein EON64_17840 [archaeon]